MSSRLFCRLLLPTLLIGLVAIPACSPPATDTEDAWVQYDPDTTTSSDSEDGPTDTAPYPRDTGTPEFDTAEQPSQDTDSTDLADTDSFRDTDDELEREAQGGIWGGELDGELDVWVYGPDGEPLEDAFVMLSDAPETPYQSWTDGSGRADFQGEDLNGAVTVSATAAGYSSATMKQVESQNVSIVLYEREGSNEPPPPRPTATFDGELTGMSNLEQPGPDERRLAYVATTKRSKGTDPPSRGEDSVVQETDGSYTLNARTGELALVAVGGLYDIEADEFEPQYFGVVRGLEAEEGEIYERDIQLELPLDQSMTFKLSSTPDRQDEANIESVEPYLDFGDEGVFSIEKYRSDSSLVTAEALPALEGKLADATIDAVGGVYTEGDDGLSVPMAEVRKRGLTSFDSRIGMPTLPGVPFLQTDGSDRNWTDPVRWQLEPAVEPDFYLVQALTPRGLAIWEGFAPGSASRLQIPSFPDFSDHPESERPDPYPTGEYYLQVIGYEPPDATYEQFRFRNLYADQVTGYGVDLESVSIRGR